MIISANVAVEEQRIKKNEKMIVVLFIFAFIGNLLFKSFSHDLIKRQMRRSFLTRPF